MRLNVARRGELGGWRWPTSSRSYGGIDVLVNNAGVDGAHEPHLLDTEPWDEVMAVNARGVFLGMKTVIPEMRKGGRGSIINVSSIAGFVGMEGTHMGYNASKAAVRIMTKSAAVQNAKQRHPRELGASRHHAADAAGRCARRSGWSTWSRRRSPWGASARWMRWPTGVLFLASDEASYITGTELVIDGGYLAI